VSARDDVLARVRSANASGAAPLADAPRDYAQTGTFAPGSTDAVDLLEDRLVDYKAAVTRTGPDGIGAAVTAALNGAARVVVPSGLDAEWVTGAERVLDDGSLTSLDLDRLDGVVTAATVACAVTGTIVLDGSPDQGRRAISLVPDLHVCVVRADQVVHSVPEMLSRVEPTRPLTLISGPTATSDIELERVEGVHGPRTLHVVIVTAA
jgi:L-lactate dehydrogenase complex protein LldG